MKKLLIYLLFLLFVISSCNSTKSENKNESNDWEIDGWRMVWHDEFEEDSLNTNLWRFETGGHGWGNAEQQYYTNSRKNGFIEDGKLIIASIKEEYNGSNYTSARINSRSGWTYGRFDIKAKLPFGKGTWPAIWMLPDEWTIGNGNWPGVGEIDIMEHVGWDPGVVHASVHTENYNHKINTQKSNKIKDTTVFSDFHLYSLEWDENFIKISMDDSLYFTYEKETNADWKTWPFVQKFHLLLNTAIGGSWGGEIDDSIFPIKFEFEYVRVYKKEQ